jgi:hypothetical protein
MINFHLDPKTHSIEFEMHPKGEEEPIKFTINKYILSNEGDKFFIEISEMKTNREWMNIAIENFLPNKKIELPAQYEKLIRLIM